MMTMLYGSQATDLTQVAEAVAEALGVKFKLHNSMYRGGDYYCFEGQGAAEIRVERNHDLIDDEPALPRWPEIGVLIYLDAFPEEVRRQYANRLDAAAASIGVRRLE
jgi:hypothetical protein